MDTDKVLNVYTNLSEHERINLVRGLVSEIAICSAEVRSLLDSLVECYKLQHLTPSQIEGILSGQVTMLIEAKQYSCGVYTVFSKGEIVCSIEIEKVEKFEIGIMLENKKRSIDMWGKVRVSGFDSLEDFIQHHRENYAPIKYVMTFKLIK